MDKNNFTYDYTFMMQDTVGEHGIAEQQLADLQPQLDQAHQDFLYAKDNDQLGYTALPFDIQTLNQVKKLANQVRQQFSTLVVLGIGGSDLGTRALHAALNHAYYNQLPNQTHKLYFAGANTDPKELADLLDILDLQQTAIFVVSKSGDTIETMSTFAYFRQKLIDQVGLDQSAQHIIVATDVEKGSLRAIVNQQGYRSLVVPANVGGRFSVLTSLGLFPAAYVGIDIEQLLAGAADMDERLVSSPTSQNPALLYAGLQFLANTHNHQPISVLMPYGEGLRSFAFWYRQLWAESLGKKQNNDGKVVNTGPTPIASVGATDQHSQVQLYNEGPFDKVVTFIVVDEAPRSLTIDQSADHLEQLSYLEGVEFNELLTTEAKSTAIALTKNGRPNATIHLTNLDEYSLGQLIYFFEVATTYSGSLYNIDAYNQPGVELGKQAMYALMGRPGHQDALADFADLLNPANPRQV